MEIFNKNALQIHKYTIYFTNLFIFYKKIFHNFIDRWLCREYTFYIPSIQK